MSILTLNEKNELWEKYSTPMVQNGLITVPIGSASTRASQTYRTIINALNDGTADTQEGLKTIRPAIFSLGQSLKEIRSYRDSLGVNAPREISDLTDTLQACLDGVAQEYTNKYAEIKFKSGAAKGLDMPEQKATEELPVLEKKNWLKNVVTSGTSGYAADLAGVVATGRSGNTAGKEIVSGALQTYIDQRDREQRFVDAYEAGDTSISKQDYEIAKEQIEFLQYYIDLYSKANDVEQNSGELTRDVAENLYIVSEKNFQEATAGQGTVGKLLTTAGVAGVQQLMDLALGAGLSGKGGRQLGSMTAMMTRSFGAGANEAAEKGGDSIAQIGAGLKTASIEYLTEKLFGGNPLYDVDVGLVNRAVRALGGSEKLLGFLASKPVSVFSEGLEEVLSGVLNPVVDYIATGEAEWPTVQQLIEEGIVGVILGGAGQVVSAANNTVTTVLEDNAVGKFLQNGGYTEALLQDAAAIGLDTADVSGTASLGYLYRTLQDKYLEQAIQERAMTLGETPSRALGEAVLLTAREEGLSGTQRKAIIKSGVAKQIVSEVKAAMKGKVTGENQWFTEAYIRPADFADGAEDGVLKNRTPESGSDAPEREAEAPETVTNEPETVAAEPDMGQAVPAVESVAETPESVPVQAEPETERGILSREVSEITDIEGMTNEEAARHWGMEFQRIGVALKEAYHHGTEVQQDAYEHLERLMGEAAAQGGGDIKAVMAYLKGATSNGNDLSDGAGRRNAGESAGVETGRVRPERDGDNGSQQPNGGTDRPGFVQTPWESSQDLGIPRGTDEKIIRRVPETVWTPEMKNAADEAAELGYSMTYVYGGIPVTNQVSGKTQRVTGVTYDESIVVQADHRVYAPEQIAQHEILHVRIHNDPAIMQEAEERLTEQFGEMEIFNMISVYARGYDFCYGEVTEAMTADEIAELNRMYLEELVCDAYAGITRHFVRSAGRTIARYSDIVQDIAESRIGMGNGSGGMPGTRYSFSREERADIVDQAERMEQEGVNRDAIWRELGVIRDASGVWVMEMDDSGMKVYPRGDALLAGDPEYRRYRELARTGDFFHPSFATLEKRYKEVVDNQQLQDYVQYEELFERYPQLRRAGFVFRRLNGEQGHYDPQAAAIVLDESLKGEFLAMQLSNVAIHEIQHAIQDMDGRAGGSNPLYWATRDAETGEITDGLRRRYREISRGLTNEQMNKFVRFMELDGEMEKLLSQGEMSPEQEARYDRYEAESDELYNELWGTEWFRELHDLHLKLNGERSDHYTEAYRNTAGELEARETERRRTMSARERRSTTPDLGWDRAVFAGGDAVTSSDERPAYEEWEVEAALYDALDHGNPAHENVIRLGQMPRYIQKLLGVEGDMYIYRDHAYENMVTRERAIEDGRPVKRRGSDIRFHGHGVERMTDAIMALEHPVMTIAGRGNRDGNPVITMLLDVEGSNGAPLYAVVGLYSNEGINGRFNEKPHILVTIAERDIEKVTPGEGRDSYEEVIRNAIENGRLIDYDKTKRATLSVIAKQARLGNITEDALNANLAQFRKEVKGYERQIGVQRSSDSLRFSMDDAGKAPEEMTAAELRRAIKGDQSMLEAYAQIERTSGLTPEVRAERDAVTARLLKERDLLKQKNEQFAAEKQAARERARARMIPTTATNDFVKEMLDIFSTQSGMRQDLGALVGRFAEDTLSRGAISYQDRARLIDRLYEAGIMTMEADAYSQDIRNNIAGTRIYVDEGTRHEFGDSESWNAFRREAFGAGVYLTSEKGDNHIDGMYHELAGMYPGSFRNESGDTKIMLEEIVAMAREGKAENVSLAEMMQRVENDTGWSISDQMDMLERKVDAAIDKFIEKAELETELKARRAVQMAKEREHRRKIMERQSASRNMRELQQRTMKSLQWLKKNERRMPAGMKEQAQELLDGLDLYAISIADEMRWSGKHQATWQDLADMYQNAREHDPNFLPSKELEMIWSRVNLKKVGELDLDALETLYRAASALRTEFYNRNNVINDEEHRMFSEAYHDSVEEIRTSGGKGKLGKIFNAEQLTPVNVLQMMGGWRRNGQFFSFARMLESGERGYKAYVVDANRVLQEFIEEYQEWIKVADGQGKDAIWYEVEVPELLELHMGDKPIFGETKKVYMTPAQKVHMYLESMNHQNLRHMAGGRTFVNRKLYEQGKREEALAQGTTIRLAPETVKKLVSDLTEEEMALAKVLQQYYNQFASERINAVSNPLYGYDKAVTQDYAPIFSNRNYTKTEPGVYDMTAEGVGHMKGREQYSKNPSWNISAFDAFERHVEQTARFVGYSIPVRNMNTLLNWRVQGSSMWDEISHVWGKEGTSYIENYIKKLQSPVFQDKSSIQKAAGKLLSNYISGVFAANPSVVMKQLLSYPMAGSVLGFGNMPTPAQIARADTELMVKYTPELEYRRMGYATPELAQLKDNPNWTQTNKVTRFIFGGGAITWTDAGAARAIWPWAENYVRKHFPDLEVGTQEQIDAGQSPFYRKVAEVYNDAVTNTQSMADISHRPAIMNHDDAITKAFTMFRSDSAQAYNTIRRLRGELARATKDGDTARARSVRISLASGVAALILSMMGGEAIDFLMALWKNKAKWYRDDEDELTAQSVGREYLSGLMESAAGLAYGGEQLVSYILGIINGEKWSFTDGIEVPGMEQLNDLLKEINNAAVGMQDIVDGAFEVVKNDGDLERYLKRHSGDILGIIKTTAVTMAQYLGGVPTANIEKYLLGTVRWISPELGAAYDSLFTTPTKDSLLGLKGADLAATVGDVLALRDVRADDGTSTELARLYETGLRSAVPGTVTETFSVNGEDFTMNAAQIQEFERVYAKAIGGNLDALVESDAYIESDDETRAKMLGKLYEYATQTAKRAVSPEYVGDTWTRKAAEAENNGVPVSMYAAYQAQGLSKTADKVAYIDDMRLTGDQKGMLYYYAVASDARKGDADAMMDAGMGWDTMYETMKEYMDVDAMEGVTAAQKAATFKTWAYNNLSTAQQNATIENLTFSTGMKASTTTYDKLMAGGLSADDALAVTTAWNNLEPEEGRSTVSDLQKMNAIIETVSSPTEQMEALSSMLDDTSRWKLTKAANYGVTAEDYVDFKNTLEDYYDYDPDGSVGSLSHDEITAALQSMNWLSIGAKAALWQIQAMGKDGKSNPFSTAIGWDVYSAYQDWKESGEVEDVKTTTAASTAADEPSGWMGNYLGLQLPVW